MRMATQSKAPGFVELFNPIVSRILKRAAILGPNALITVRGRKSGELRSTPVALLEIDGRRWVVGTFGETNWVRNLRAAGEASLTVGSRHEDVAARELTRDERAAFFVGVLAPYARGIRVGPVLLSILGAGDVVKDPIAASVNRPVFELRAA